MSVEFSAIAEQTILKIVDAVEAQDSEGDIDIDFNSDIIYLITKSGSFVINKHSAAKEIWLASPISGPYHFSYTNSGWKSKYNDDLFDILEKELVIKFDRNLI